MADVSIEQVLTPSSIQEVADIMRGAGVGRYRISSSRGAASSESGEPESLKRLDLRNMNSVVDYPARDMTITVQAGMPLGELTKILAAENQQLPIDCSDKSVTVGALVASNTAGPRQFGYGTLRDYLIGLEAVDGRGRVFHAGGRVVKNVAGYDLCRLMIGSRGALGILTQLTFKLKPIPAYISGMTFRFANASDAERALEQLNVTAAMPVILDFASTSPERLFAIYVAVDGTQQACEWQMEQLNNDCNTEDRVPGDVVDSATVNRYCQDPKHGWLDTALRIQTLPSKVMSIAQELAANGHSSYGHAGSGILYVGNDQQNKHVLTICENIVSRDAGNVVEWNRDHPRDSKDPLTVQLRKAFDPDSVFAR